MTKTNSQLTDKKVVIPKNITKQIVKQSKKYAEVASISFYSEVTNRINDFPITSPIEQSLYSSIFLCMHINNMQIVDAHEINGKDFLLGLEVKPQFKIGKYRVDFKVTNYWEKKSEQMEKTIIIECDSQKWHERNEEQRRYEKERDRFILKSGFKVFHYTGKEILANPIGIAEEIIKEVRCV